MSSSNQLSVDKHPRVGLGVFVVKDDKFLIGKRKGSHGSGMFEFFWYFYLISLNLF